MTRSLAASLDLSCALRAAPGTSRPGGPTRAPGALVTLMTVIFDAVTVIGIFSPGTLRGSSPPSR